jgi:hypothetical protein
LRAADRPQRIAFSKAAHCGRTIRKDFEPGCYVVGNAQLSQKLCDMNAGG